MLARSLPQGPEAISFQNTLFRVSELCWVKAVRLSVPDMVLKVASLLAALVWVLVMKSAKGSFLNVEFLLAGFPLLMAWPLFGSYKIGCTGDFEEAYDARGGFSSQLFRNWIETLRKREPGWLHLKGSSYDVLFNPNRIAWVRPCFQWSLYPLIVAVSFIGYLFLMGKGINLEGMPVFDDFQVLLFPGGAGSVRMMCYLVIILALANFGFSFKRSVEVCGAGGVQDVFAVTATDQESILKLLAGGTVAPKVQVAPQAAQGRTITATVSQPVPRVETPVTEEA